MQNTETNYQFKFREILKSSTSFKEIQDKINNLISNSCGYFCINSVHYVKYPIEGLKIFYSLSLPHDERDESYSNLVNFLRKFSNTFGFLLFEYEDVPLISEKVMNCLVPLRRLAAIAEYYEECCNEDHRLELNEIQRESRELHSRLNFLVQKENKILQEIRNEVDQFIKCSISDIDSLYGTEEHSIKFLTENPTKTALLAILQEQGSKDD